MYSWSAPLGHPGDLDELVAVLVSLARTKYGVERISLVQFFDAVERVAREYPDLFEGVDFQRSGDAVSSRALGNALQGSLNFGLEICNPSFQYVTVNQGESEKIISWSEKRSGERFVLALERVAESFARLIEPPKTVTGSLG